MPPPPAPPMPPPPAPPAPPEPEPPEHTVAHSIAHELHAEAAEAAVKRIFVLGDGLSRHEAALASEPFAAALVERARDDGSLAALLENNLGIVFDLAGDDAAAQRHFERTVTLLQHAGKAALPPRESEQVRIPFALAIAIGMLAAYAWPLMR